MRDKPVKDHIGETITSYREAVKNLFIPGTKPSSIIVYGDGYNGKSHQTWTVLHEILGPCSASEDMGNGFYRPIDILGRLWDNRKDPVIMFDFDGLLEKPRPDLEELLTKHGVTVAKDIRLSYLKLNAGFLAVRAHLIFITRKVHPLYLKLCRSFHFDFSTEEFSAWLDTQKEEAQKHFDLAEALPPTDFDGKIREYSEALRINPKHPEAFYKRCCAYCAKGQLDHAFKDCDDMIALNPDDANAFYVRGRMFMFRAEDNIFMGGDEDLAMRYDRAVADYGRAVTDLTQAVDLKPGEGSYREDLEEALRKKEETIKGKEPEVLHDRGIKCIKRRDYDQAIEAFTRLIQLEQNSARRYSNRAYAYGAKGDYDKAIADYTQAIKLSPENEYAYNDRGCVYCKKGDADHALEDSDKAIALNHFIGEFFDTRACAYMLKGDYDSAIKDYTRAVKLEPDDAGIKQNLEEAKQKKAGQKKEGR
jgi:tetratricopeptide (TPR) repeat protein